MSLTLLLALGIFGASRRRQLAPLCLDHRAFHWIGGSVSVNDPMLEVIKLGASRLRHLQSD